MQAFTIQSAEDFLGPDFSTYEIIRNFRAWTISPDSPDMIFVNLFTPAHFYNFENLPQKRVNRDILDLKYYIFGVFIHLI